MSEVGLAHMFDDFRGGLAAWHTVEIGTGRVKAADGLTLTVSPGRGYHDAQISDYDYKTWGFHWRAPVRMTVIAHASRSGDQLRGTAGFGLWNHPLSPDMRRLPRLPAAIWFFFGAPPHDFQVALDTVGHGWKTQTLDAAHARAFVLAPVALPLMLLMRIPPLYRPIYRRIQRILKVGEAALSPSLLAGRHEYTLEWGVNHARFWVDGELVHESPFSPTGALGFIAWIDNQYLIATPRGRFKWGIVPLEKEQSIMIESVRMERLE